MKHEKYTEAEPDYMNPDNTVEAPSYGSITRGRTSSVPACEADCN